MGLNLSLHMTRQHFFFLLALLLFKSSLAFCDIKLPRLISDGAILQREVNFDVWGWASPGEKVELSFDGSTFNTEAGQNGEWRISLPPQPAGGPHEMIFKGNNNIVLKNILFGDVWLCSGQSNMELTMERLRDTYPGIIENCKNPFIRQFLVPDEYDFNITHNDFDSGSWTEADPSSIYDFSGVAYFFALELYDKYEVPIGLINSALGGSPVEAWMSEEALKEFPDAYKELQEFKDEDLIQKIKKENKSITDDWYSELNHEDKGFVKGEEWYREETDENNWEEMEVPGFWANTALGDVNGVVWFRKKVTIPLSMCNKETKLWLGRLVDQDHVYVNGEFVGSTGYRYPPRKYSPGKGILKEGENNITVRLINESGEGGFIPDKAYFLTDESDTIDLTGSWKYRLGAKMDPIESTTFIRWKAGGLFKKMIAPVTAFHIKGVIWYQGESNARDPQSYAARFPALIRDWRKKWDVGDFPFLYVQLANYMAESANPTESKWAELRQAQLETLAVPNTGMAVSLDLGEWNDIHPLNKKDVGLRLAREAFKIAYGEEAFSSSPVPLKHKFLKDRVWVRFSEKDLMAKNGEDLKTFEISEDGEIFHKANARIKGGKVFIWHDSIVHPVAVRYAWSDNPRKANLYSGDGLPASPFEIFSSVLH